MTTRAQELDLLGLPLHGSRLIEASAGTGKTYTIAALYLRLVLGHGELPEGTQALTPPQILVMTFTEAATQELRSRIRDALATAARVFRAQDPGTVPGVQDIHTQLRDEYTEAERPGAARRLELAAEWMDEAAVSTIHGWCYRMLREHAFDSGSLFTQDLASDQQELLAEASRDYWRRFVYPQPPAQLVLVRNAFGPDPETLLQKIRPLVGHLPADAADAELESPEGLETALGRKLARLEAMKRAWREDFAAIKEQFEALRGTVLDSRKYASPDKLLNVMHEWAEDPGALRPAGVGKESVLERLSAAGMRDRLKGGQALPEDLHPAFVALDAHAEVCVDDRERLLQAAARQVDARFRQAQRQRAQMGFNDLLTRLRDALDGPGGEHLAATLRTQFPVALVDEFQDTDPVQYRIFQRVYGIDANPRDRGVLLIGDPKQSIYGFRGADIHTYLAARAATAGRHYTLGRNFRSTKALVDGVNRLFQHAEGWADGAFLFRGEDDNPLPFVAVGAQGRPEVLEQAGQALPAVTLWCDDPGTPVPKGAYRERMAQACASYMVELLNAGADGTCGFRRGERLSALRPRDMAVLVRGRAEADAIRGALRQRGVRSVYLSDRESVYATDEAGDLLRWLRACAEPTSERLLRAALATATLGQSLGELHRLTVDELAWEARVEQFRDYRRLWQSRGVLPMLRRLLHDFEVPRRLRATAEGERALTNLLHLSELLQQAAAELDGEQALIRHLLEHRAGDGETGDEQILRLESDEDLVKVVTLHKSKGLEYPLVFLPFACSFRLTDAKKDVPWRDHPPQGGARWVFSMDAAVYERAERERLAEDLRLLYVGMTRARHACWLGIAPVVSGNGKRNQFHQTAAGYLLAGPDGVEAGALEAALQAAAGAAPAVRVGPLPEASTACVRGAVDAVATGPAREPPARGFERWWVASYSAIAAHDDGVAPIAPGSAREDVLREGVADAGRAMPEPGELEEPGSAHGLHAFPRGPGPGTFLHGLLEWAAQQGLAAQVAHPERLVREVEARCERQGWGEWSAIVNDWMQQLLTAAFPLEGGGHFNLGALARYQPELEFLYPARNLKAEDLDGEVRASILPGAVRPPLGNVTLNGMLKGFVDLVFEHEGRYYVADYKSNWLGTSGRAYTAERLRAAVLEHRYDLQLVLYTLALHRQLQARLPGYDYDRHMGGGVYLFLRGVDAPGHGVFHHCPPRELIEQLDTWMAHGGPANTSPGHGDSGHGDSGREGAA
ncbi:exodeoxyribonuclease V subunit beta [Thioalkalivibrio sp. ALJ16]|uniref:exodeoxyribonuclease V subunit beta n=1 Tax=Thioalkalivibrio sp. ALJ16 TaxID=1158762 RepID=UPI0003760976|nr:exodeoxyribonuclease V subunit beta [Thioalkalivibrio sp. ALJ16]